MALQARYFLLFGQFVAFRPLWKDADFLFPEKISHARKDTPSLEITKENGKCDIFNFRPVIFADTVTVPFHSLLYTLHRLGVRISRRRHPKAQWHYIRQYCPKWPRYMIWKTDHWGISSLPKMPPRSKKLFKRASTPNPRTIAEKKKTSCTTKSEQQQRASLSQKNNTKLRTYK